MPSVYFDFPDHQLAFSLIPGCLPSGLLASLAPLTGSDDQTEKDWGAWEKFAVAKTDLLERKHDRKIFAILRNPWDRIAALFSDQDNNQTPNEFFSFVSKIAPDSLATDSDYLAPQTQFLTGKGQLMIPDMTLRFERLNDDFKLFQSAILENAGIEIHDLPPQTFQSQLTPTIYERRTRVAIRQLYASDIQGFHYHFPAASLA